MSVCLCVCLSHPKNHASKGLETSGRRAYCKYWDLGRQFFLELCNDFFLFKTKKRFFQFSRSTPLCWVEEWQREGSMAVALFVQQMTGDMWQVTGDVWHLTGYTWQVTHLVSQGKLIKYSSQCQYQPLKTQNHIITAAWVFPIKLD